MPQRPFRVRSPSYHLLNARIAELEARLGEVAELNARIAELEGKLANKPSDYVLRQTELYIDEKKKKIAELEAKRYYFYSANQAGHFCSNKASTTQWKWKEVWDHVCDSERLCITRD
jgi:uncharacterized coiled-coil protein SlyX